MMTRNRTPSTPKPLVQATPNGMAVRPLPSLAYHPEINWDNLSFISRHLKRYAANSTPSP